MQRACGTLACMRPWIDQAVRSGASGRFMVSGSSLSSSRSSDALMREKCFQRGFMRNFLPSAETARLRWLATASCQSMHGGEPESRRKVDTQLPFVGFKSAGRLERGEVTHHNLLC